MKQLTLNKKNLLTLNQTVVAEHGLANNSSLLARGKYNLPDIKQSIWHKLQNTFTNHHKSFVKYSVITFRGVAAASCCQIERSSQQTLATRFTSTAAFRRAERHLNATFNKLKLLTIMSSY